MFKVQVRVKEYNAGAWIHVYRDMHPANGPAYEFPTLDDAYRVIRQVADSRSIRGDYRIVDSNNREVQ